MMKENTSKLPTVQLIPASQQPLQMVDFTSKASEGSEHLDELNGMRATYRWLCLKDPEQEEMVDINLEWLSLPEIEQLAHGKELRAPIGDVKEAGRLRLLRGHEEGRLKLVLLDFLPDKAVAQGMSFASWYEFRFPKVSFELHESRNEAWWIHFHALWAEEVQPCPTLAADDALLCTAVTNNHEHWVEAILACQPRIEVRPGAEKSISETALGIAMENTGMFGTGPGFMCGCHRRYRDDDYSQAEDPNTWIPRAERIAARLKAAGAVDYSPLLEACRAGRENEVERMLKEGFPPNFSIYGHTTALCEAVQPGHEDVCDLLLCHGADPNQPRPFDTSMSSGGEIHPLTLAIRHPAILKRLLHAGADPNRHRDDSEETPVVLAGGFDTREHVEEVFKLVDIATICGKHGRSAAFYLDAKNLEFCRELIPGELLDRCDGHGMTPLLHAITYEDVDKARLLLEMGADQALPGMIWEDEANSILRFSHCGSIRTQYLTPIQAALQIGHQDLVGHLFDLGACPVPHSIGIKMPSLQNEEQYAQLCDRLQGELEQISGDKPSVANRYATSFQTARSRRCESLLAALLMSRSGETIQRHAEFFECIDLVSWAEELGIHPAAIEPFRSGSKLGNAAWMDLLEGEIRALKEAIQAFDTDLNSQQTDDSSHANTSDLLAPLKRAELALMSATFHITGKQLNPLNLDVEVCRRASADFEGGTARAFHDAETTGEVGFDDFIEALSEHFRPGSTLDQGKLLQAVRLAAARLEDACSRLRGSINSNSKP